MQQLFVQLLNMSLSAGFLVLVVILARLVLKKAPKWIHCLLWGLVALRLMIPYFPSSTWSLLPEIGVVTNESTTVQTGIPAINQAVNPALVQAPVNPLEQLLCICWIIWLVGVGLFCLYSLISWLRLRRMVRICVEDRGVYLCDDIDTPFILGVFRPRIYLPSGIDPADVSHVIAHERAHLQRRDHWWKPIGFTLLALYWFHPLLWVGYILLCRDIESACDEKVIRNMDNTCKKQYSEALLACSVHRRAVLHCPLAFGELAVSQRIKNVLSYKKPVFWIVAAAIAACGVLAVCFLTDPAPCVHTYEQTQLSAATCTQEGQLQLTCTQCYDVQLQPIAVTEHLYDQGVVITPATCQLAGQATYSCTVCGYQQTLHTPLAAHTWGESFVTPPLSCTQTGETRQACTLCDAQQVITPATQTAPHHNMVTTTVTAATCTTAGTGINTCADCGHQEDCALPSLGHTYETVVETPGTCSMVGVRRMVCAGCGKEEVYTTPKTDDHQYAPGFNGTLACIFCGKIKQTRGDTARDLTEDMVYDNDSQPPFPVIGWDLTP